MTSIQEQLKQFGLTPNKALGQNFLQDEAAIALIAEAAGADGREVLEVGPGLGALTRALCARAAHVTAVELDEKLAEALKARLAGEENLRVVRQDFLKFDLASLPPDLCVAANLPYYITTPICLRLFRRGYPRLTLMVQLEAAQRFTAQPRDKVYGPLSVLAACQYHISTLMRLGPESYYPRPEVDSLVLQFVKKTDAPDISGLDALLNAAFAMRRKTLANNLKGAGYADPQGFLEACGLDPAVRGEALAPADFLRLNALLRDAK